jgi:hypothetical protein
MKGKTMGTEQPGLTIKRGDLLKFVDRENKKELSKGFLLVPETTAIL